MNQLKTRQICLFFIAFLPVTKLFMLPSILAGVSNENLWFSAVVSFLIDFLTVLALIFVCKKANTDIYGLLELNFGKVGKNIILVLYLIYFILKALIPINEQKEYISLTFYETMPNIVAFLPFFAVSFYFCVRKKRILGRCADILWFSTSLGLLIIFGLSLTGADFNALKPILQRKVENVFLGAYKGSNWYGDAVYLMFFIGEFVYKKRDMIKILLSFAVASISVVFFMILFYAVFSSISFRQMFALTEISKYTSVINNTGRFDYIGIVLILFSGIFSLSMPLFIATEISTKLFNLENKWVPALIINVTLFIFFLISGEFFGSLQNFIINYGSIYFLLLGNVFPICLLFLRKNKESYYAIS